MKKFTKEEKAKLRWVERALKEPWRPIGWYSATKFLYDKLMELSQ